MVNAYLWLCSYATWLSCCHVFETIAALYSLVLVIVNCIIKTLLWIIVIEHTFCGMLHDKKNCFLLFLYTVEGLMIMAELVSCFKRTLARMLFIVVSLGFGIVRYAFQLYNNFHTWQHFDARLGN